MADRERRIEEAARAAQNALTGLIMHAVRRGVAEELEPFMTKAGKASDDLHAALSSPSPAPAAQVSTETVAAAMERVRVIEERLAQAREVTPEMMATPYRAPAAPPTAERADCGACAGEPSLQHTCPKRCSVCDGYGLVTIIESVEGITYEAGDECPACGGTGKATREAP